MSLPGQALPVPANIIQGDAQLQIDGQQLDIIQASDFLHLQFDGFNIGSNERVTFHQPSVSSIAISEVLSRDPTQIAGQLSANGQLFILAPGGLIIHKGASIEAVSFFASTLQASSIGESGIQFSSGGSQRGIENYGAINIEGGGFLQLLSARISNYGDIENQQGQVGFNVAESAMVRFNGELIAIELQQAALDGVIKNYGSIKASAGDVVLQASVRNQIHELVVINQGDITAQSVYEQGGDIYIGSNEGDIENHGILESLGEVDKNREQSILVEAQRIANFGVIKNNAAGLGNGGYVELNARDTVVLLPHSLIQVNADTGGNGGEVKVFSPGTALFRRNARIEAQAGFYFGDGGFVDVSGWQHIEINGRVSTLALNGHNGEFLIDPYNVTISNGGTANQGFAGLTYTPANTPSNIFVNDLVANLQAGNVTVVTTGAGAEAGNITVAVAIDLDATNGNTLQFNADGNIEINGHIVDQNTGTVDGTHLGFQAGGNISIADGVVVDSGGGVITMSAGGAISLSNVTSDGGNIFLTGVSVADSGDTGFGYDINASGGEVSFNIVTNIGGTSYASALEVTNSAVKIVASTNGDNVYLINNAATDLTINDVAYDGGNGLNLNVRATGTGDIVVAGNISDAATGSADSATINLETQNSSSNIIINDGASIISNGGNIALNSAGDLSLTETWSGGGTINVTATNIIDLGSTASDLNSGGGVITMNISGDIGSDINSALEVSNSILDINNTGANQSAYIRNTSGQDLTLCNVDFNGTGNYALNVYTTGTGNLILNGQIQDSATGSADVGTFHFESQNAGSDITSASGAVVRSYGGNINYTSLGQVGLGNNITGGGNMTIIATQVFDDNTGQNIYTNGGTVDFQVTGDVGVAGAANALEITDSIVSGTIGASNATWQFDTASGANYLGIGEVDFNGASGFTLNVATNNGGSINLSGSVKDSSPATVDTANFSFQTIVAGDDITAVDGVKLHSYGGDININSIDDISLPQTYSGGGAINLTAGGNIIDIYNGIDLSSDGGVLTINAVGDVGGTAFSTAIELVDSILDMNLSANNQNIYINVGRLDAYLNINNIDYNGGNGLVFDVIAQQGSDIVITGDIYDSDTSSAESATFNLVTNSSTGDITINSGSTIRSGDAGSIAINSANDLFLTGVFGGGGGTVITAANDIIDNGDVTRDVQSTGTLLISTGRHVADGDALEVIATSVNIDMGTGNHNFVLVGDGSLATIEVDGANGANLSVLGSGDISLTGSINDANGADDRINLTLGTSSPGFIIFPNAGYTVPGALTFWDGTAGIKDATDERISIIADSLTSSGNNFLLNTGPIIWDLTVDDLDLNDSTGTHLFEINNSKNLRLIDLDGDGEFLLGKNIKLNISGDLSVPAAVMNDVDDQLWIIADDIDDPDADNIVTMRDSADAGPDFNLIIDLTAANDVQINSNSTVFDGTVVAGGILTLNNTLQNSNLNLGSDLNGDGQFINGNGDISIISDAVITLDDTVGLNTNGSLSLSADFIQDSDDIINVTATDVFLQYTSPINNLYGVNLTANRFDVNIVGDYSVTGLSAVELFDLDSNAQVLGGVDDFSFSSANTLQIPVTGLTTTGSLNLTASDISDGDSTLIFNTGDLFFKATTGVSANYQISGNISRFDVELSAANSDVHVTSAVNLDVGSFDGDADGNIMEGMDFLSLTTTNGANLTLADVGINMTGGLRLNVAGQLSTTNNQAINLTAATLNVDVLGASSDLAFATIASNDIDIRSNSALIFNGGTLSTTGDIYLHGSDISSDTDRNLNLTANQVYLQFDNQVATNTLLINAGVLDAVGSQGLNVISVNSFQLTDINGDNQILAGFSDLDLTTNGVITMDDVGLNVSGDLVVVAQSLTDTDASINLSANRVFVNYTSPLAPNYGISGAISFFNAALSGSLQVDSSTNIEIQDWQSSGSVLNALNDFKITSSGNILLPATGLQTSSSLWLEGVSISDGDANLILNSNALILNSSQMGVDYVLNTNAREVDVSLAGLQSNLRLNSSTNLQIMDLTGDGLSLSVADGYAWIDTAGTLDVSDTLNVSDATNDGSVGGWLYLGYNGSASIGLASAANIIANGTQEGAVSGLNPYASAQVVIRQQGALNVGNSLRLGNLANISAVGGDVVLDITNNSGDFANSGELFVDSGAQVTARNQLSDQLAPIIYTGYTADGIISASSGRTVNVVGVSLIGDAPVDAVADEALADEVEQAVTDAIKGAGDAIDQVVAEDIQNETVSSVESSPNVNFALNEMFSGCRQGNSQDSRCKVKEEISRFLGRFLIGGSMPKAQK